MTANTQVFTLTMIHPHKKVELPIIWQDIGSVSLGIPQKNVPTQNVYCG